MKTARRAKTKAPDKQRTTGDFPLTPEQILAKPDIKPKRRPPAHVRKLLSTPRAYFVSRREIRGTFERIKAPGSRTSTYRLDLPDGAYIGAAGQSRAIMRRRELERGAKPALHTSAYCPPWAHRVFRPAAARMPAPATTLTKDGALITPHSGVFGADDRVVYYPISYPWCCVGRIFTQVNGKSVGAGTGFLVGPRHVLTASHVCPWDAPNWGMLFCPAFYDGNSVAGNGAFSWVSDFRALANVTAQDSIRAHDFAVLRLYDPLGDALGWFGTKTYQNSWTGFTFGLHGHPGMIANGQRPAGQAFIPIVGTAADGAALELKHQGDASPGNSGSPFWTFWSDNLPYVMGVESAGRVIPGVEDVNVAAGGAEMVNLLKFWLAGWP